MALTLADLGTGQLAASKGTMLTASAPTAARVTLVNTDSSARTVNLYVKKDGANSRRFGPKNLSIGPGEEWTSQLQTLESGDLIEGDASAATVVDYTINGFKEA